MDKPSSPSDLPPSSFWHHALHGMHPSVRVRYYQWFVMAAAMDRSFDDVLALWRNANQAGLQTCRAVLR